ncbi:hypothetical protein E2C01_037411 [Portunus trituberculatus]|uniref:Uncharacterized protein n=1 Tax=Portunus trituberculatus TaxID=210409 RepID=A0A5B7FEW2_PORTR|nr:hypothetical protein [Portunus trituberculatus]
MSFVITSSTPVTSSSRRPPRNDQCGMKNDLQEYSALINPSSIFPWLHHEANKQSQEPSVSLREQYYIHSHIDTE